MLLPIDPLLNVGDRVQIHCPEAPDICVERVVGPDGTVDVPGIGPLPAARRRGETLASNIAQRLPESLLPPRVEVRWIAAPRGEVAVTGAVARPLQLYAPSGIASDRLFAAARLLAEADRSLLGPSRRIAPGVVVVPTASAERKISVLGAVVAPLVLPPTENLLLGSAIESAGGLGAHGDPNGIVVLRLGESIPVGLPLDRDFRLRPGDVVRVGLVAARHYVVVRGSVQRPGSIEYAPGMTATRALAAAGGLLPEAKAGTLVWQTGAKTYRLSLAFLLAGRIPDPVLGPEDTLVVEKARP